MSLAGGLAVLLSFITVWLMAGGDRRRLGFFALLAAMHLAA